MGIFSCIIIIVVILVQSAMSEETVWHSTRGILQIYDINCKTMILISLFALSNPILASGTGLGHRCKFVFEEPCYSTSTDLFWEDGICWSFLHL